VNLSTTPSNESWTDGTGIFVIFGVVFANLGCSLLLCAFSVYVVLYGAI
jgi:hypothetical protein